jgi:hypothetical protein
MMTNLPAETNKSLTEDETKANSRTGSFRMSRPDLSRMVF